KTKVITYTTLVLATVNIILDYLLIFGHHGFPEMGIAGAALASVIAEGFALLFFITYTMVTVKIEDYGMFSFLGFSLTRLRNIVRIAVPIMMQMFLSLAVWFVFFLLIEKLGESALAVSNIIRSILVVLLVPVWGFATATNTLVSYLIGDDRAEEVTGLLKKIILLCFIGVLIVVSTGLAFPRLLFEIYTNDRDLIEMGIPILYVISIGAVSLSFGFILFNGVSGTGKTNISLLIEVIVLAIYLLFGYAMVFIFETGVTLVWMAEILYGTLLAIFSFLYIRSGRWKSSRV
ncbi:MAG: MATE family efflux transporter, partial [bacterium]